VIFLRWEGNLKKVGNLHGCTGFMLLDAKVKAVTRRIAKLNGEKL
jgi:hypothetical protein